MQTIHIQIPASQSLPHQQLSALLTDDTIGMPHWSREFQHPNVNGLLITRFDQRVPRCFHA